MRSPSDRRSTTGKKKFSDRSLVSSFSDRKNSSSTKKLSITSEERRSSTTREKNVAAIGQNFDRIKQRRTVNRLVEKESMILETMKLQLCSILEGLKNWQKSCRRIPIREFMKTGGEDVGEHHGQYGRAT
ncbi:hypothetical protein L1987_59183 [Smallanthus sonchifolius]|uniref:Uncharacterized protein n=1 Tax=Smallanthus sonchifolius TaxID=185202 RepID=A0ACB9D4K1_9ASTR|nr:hypothetical protein L1987_59183 [Smallanthus sonchifolius]